MARSVRFSAETRFFLFECFSSTAALLHQPGLAAGLTPPRLQDDDQRTESHCTRRSSTSTAARTLIAGTSAASPRYAWCADTANPHFRTAARSRVTASALSIPFHMPRAASALIPPSSATSATTALPWDRSVSTAKAAWAGDFDRNLRGALARQAAA
jgi:hypothetical protein